MSASFKPLSRHRQPTVDAHERVLLLDASRLFRPEILTVQRDHLSFATLRGKGAPSLEDGIVITFEGGTKADSPVETRCL